MSQEDPFNDSVNELRALTVRAKAIQHSVTQRGFVDAAKTSELEELCAEINELVGLLQETQQVVENKGGRVHGKIFSANEIVERQRVLHSLYTDATEATTFLKHLKSRSEARNTAFSSAVTALPPHLEQSSKGSPDGFLVAQEHEQREATREQDEVIDRLAYGLQELRETGINITDELEQQDEMLTEVERDVSGVQLRLRAVNAKVDKLLASMSNRGKVCTIVLLTLTLVFLAFFVL